MLKYYLKKITSTPLEKLPIKIYRGIKNYLISYPRLVLLETASVCNLHCKHCFINDYGLTIPDGIKKILTYKEFVERVKLILPAIKHTELFQFTTFEPTMQKNLFKMMDHILSINKNIKFPINTNAQLITRDYLNELSNYPLYDFNVSLDGINKKTVEDFKTDSKFEKIIECLETVKSLNFNCDIGAVFVAHKNNIKELEEYPDFVYKYGVKNIFVNNLLCFNKEFEYLTLYKNEGNSYVDDIFEKTILNVKKNNQVIYLPGTKPIKLGCTTCEILIIDINGNVCPCDFHAVKTPFTYFGNTKICGPVIFGNIFENEALSIFRSQKAKHFRQLHRSGSIPNECTNCIDAYGLMCSHRKVFK